MEAGRLANYRCRTRSIPDQVLRPGRSRSSFTRPGPFADIGPTGVMQLYEYLNVRLASVNGEMIMPRLARQSRSRGRDEVIVVPRT
jgi:hypothetical protein